MALKDLYSIVGQRIRDYRDLQGLTQADVSKNTGINRATISNIESGKQQASLHYLYLIAESLSIEIFALLPTMKEVNIVAEDHWGVLNEKIHEQNLDEATKNSILQMLNKKPGNDI